MSTLAIVSRWVEPSELPDPANLPLMLPSELRNLGGPECFLRPALDNSLRKEGDSYDMREFDGEPCTSVGHIFFHPGTREPPIPPLAELEAFMAANPDYPIVVDTKRTDPCERPHIVLARFVTNQVGKIGLDRNGLPLVSLFTFAADHASRAFDPATHVKDGEQKEGVDIFDWAMVNFDSEYRRDSLFDTFRAIYRDLCRLT